MKHETRVIGCWSLVTAAAILVLLTARWRNQYREYEIGHSGPRDPLAVRFDFHATSSSTSSFLRAAAEGPHTYVLRWASVETSAPFFIVSEGIEDDRFTMIPSSPAPRRIPGIKGTEPPKKNFQVQVTSATVEQAFVKPLQSGASDLNTTLVENVLLVQDPALSDRPDWPLNGVVEELQDRPLTVLEAEQLLVSKYGCDVGMIGMESAGSNARLPAPQLCRGCLPQEIIWERTGDKVTVRELVIALLRRYTERVYGSSLLERVNLFHIRIGLPSPTQQYRFSVTYPILPRPVT